MSGLGRQGSQVNLRMDAADTVCRESENSLLPKKDANIVFGFLVQIMGGVNRQ